MEKDHTGSVPWKHHPAQYLVPQTPTAQEKEERVWAGGIFLQGIFP